MKTRITSIVTIVLLLIAAATTAQERVGSKLSDVTLFFNGAELTHKASATLKAGSNEVEIEGLSPHIDMSSLRVNTTNNVLVSSFEYSIDYLISAKEHSPVIKRIKDSVALYEQRLEGIKIESKVNDEIFELLRAGVSKNVSGAEQGLSVDQLARAMSYYKDKSSEMHKTRNELVKREQETSSNIQRLKAQLNQESIKGNKTSGVLKLNTTSALGGKTDITITYVTNAASWTPFYDINIRSIGEPIEVAMKSMVRQTTGLDWESVNITLSTATPSTGREAPLFTKWFLRELRPTPEYDMLQSYPAAQNVHSYEKRAMHHSREAEDVAEVYNPIVILDGVEISYEEYSEIDPRMFKDVVMLYGSDAIQAYGQRGANGAIIATLKSEMDDYIVRGDDEIQSTYAISIPYSIPGNGKVQTIDLSTNKIKADYKFYSAPKLDMETYLIAEISDWEKLGLLAGKANLTYDGTYIGETIIDASSPREKLTLTLGSDKRVAVKREKLQDFSSKRTFGSTIQQEIGYQITVRNNQSRPISMVLKDQYPTSTRKDITVELGKETTPWTFDNRDIGVLSWEETLQPGETKTYRIYYNVRYPKDIDINL